MTRKKFLKMMDGAVVTVDFIGIEKHFDVIKNKRTLMYFSVYEKYLTVLESGLEVFDDAKKINKVKAFFKNVVSQEFGWKIETVNLL